MKGKWKSIGFAAYSLVLLFLLIGYIVYPMGNTFFQAFFQDGDFTLAVFREYLSNPNHIQVIQNTFWVGVGAVICCGLLGTALAIFMTFLDFRRKKLIHVLLLSPMMIPGVIIVIAFVQLYGESGMVTKAIELLLGLENPPYSFSGFPGILFVIAYTQYVYFYLNISVALKYVDYSAVEAAMSLGAGKLTVFRDVILPTIMPALITSCIMTFVSGIGAFTAPNLIGGGYKVLSTQIVRSKANNKMEIASVQVMILFLMSISILLLMQYYKKHHTYTRSVRPSAFQAAGKRKTLFRAAAGIFMGLQILLILLPIGGILYLSFNTTHAMMTEIFPHEYTLENYSKIVQSDRVFEPVINSLKMSLTAMGAGLLLTVPVSYFSWRKKGRAISWARYMMLLPWCMPMSVTAINLINAFNVPSIFAFGKALIGGYWILPIGYTIAALPLLLSSNDVAMESLNPVLEDASRSLGASGLQTIGLVVLPNVAPGIAAGGILVFIRTIGEYTMSALLYGIHNRPLAISMVVNMQEYNVGVSMAYGVLGILISYLALALVLKLDKKRFVA